MKKIIALMTAIIIIACGLTSCNHQHNFGEWKVLKSATCTENGLEARYCDCGEKQSEIIFANHNYINGVCTFCNEAKNDICEHENIFVFPGTSSTCTKNGCTDEIICTDCGVILVYSKIIKAQHNFINGVCTVCGYEKSGQSTLLMEAEYTYMDNVTGAGLSSNNSGLSMIYGNGTEDQKAMWSNGYYVGYTHNSNTVITFEFEASKATNATLIFSIGCELYDKVFTAGENLDILLNGEHQFFNWFITCSAMDEAKFYEYKLSNINLAEGTNKIEIKVLPQNSIPLGPLVDYVKVVGVDSSVELSWKPYIDNPYRRDNEV